MKISILTPSFNQGSFLEKNIQSVLAQNYADFEHIVIDGGSTDNTVEILRKFPHLKWVSEADRGQADALNKGLAMATGDLIGWINSDDYYEENIFSDVISHFQDPSIRWIIGNVTFCYTDLGFKKPIISSTVTYKRLLQNPDIVKQQGVFFRKNVLEDLGGWASEYFMVMDFDLWLRLSRIHPPKMINKNYAYFVWHGEQKSTYKNLICQAKEINAILKAHGVSILSRGPIIIKKYKYAAKGLLKTIFIKFKIIDKKFKSIALSEAKIK